MDTVNEWLWTAPVAAQIGLGWRILRSGRVRRYPLLLAFVAAVILIAVFLVSAESVFHPRAYAKFWVAGMVLYWSLTALALTEACTGSLKAYPRFGQVGSVIIRSVLIITGLGIAGLLFLAPASWTSQFSRFLQAQGHIVQGSLALLGLSVLAFAHWARLALEGNSRLVLVALTVFCAGETAMASGVLGASSRWVFYVGIAWATLCWSTMAVCWSAAPEPAEVRAPEPEEAWTAAGGLARMRSTNDHLSDLLRRG